MSPIDSLNSARQDIATTAEPEAAPPCSSTKKTWIEIVLEDENGVRVPSEEYLVTAPDGTEFSGVLDSNGFARVANIDPGTCQVSFPRIHKTEWNKE